MRESASRSTCCFLAVRQSRGEDIRSKGAAISASLCEAGPARDVESSTTRTEEEDHPEPEAPRTGSTLSLVVGVAEGRIGSLDGSDQISVPSQVNRSGKIQVHAEASPPTAMTMTATPVHARCNPPSCWPANLQSVFGSWQKHRQLNIGQTVSHGTLGQVVRAPSQFQFFVYINPVKIRRKII